MPSNYGLWTLLFSSFGTFFSLSFHDTSHHLQVFRINLGIIEKVLRLRFRHVTRYYKPDNPQIFLILPLKSSCCEPIIMIYSCFWVTYY